MRKLLKIALARILPQVSGQRTDGFMDDGYHLITYKRYLGIDLAICNLAETALSLVHLEICTNFKSIPLRRKCINALLMAIRVSHVENLLCPLKEPTPLYALNKASCIMSSASAGFETMRRIV